MFCSSSDLFVFKKKIINNGLVEADKTHKSHLRVPCGEGEVKPYWKLLAKIDGKERFCWLSHSSASIPLQSWLVLSLHIPFLLDQPLHKGVNHSPCLKVSCHIFLHLP